MNSNDDLNTYIDAGLPNITGGVFPGLSYAFSLPLQSASGAFGLPSTASNYGKPAVNSDGVKVPIRFDFDASRSSSIYGNSTTVTPKSLKVAMWIRTA